MSTELTWIRVRCESGSCVEVAAIEAADIVALRCGGWPLDVLRITREEWAAFVLDVKAGHFDAV